MSVVSVIVLYVPHSMVNCKVGTAITCEAVKPNSKMKMLIKFFIKIPSSKKRPSINKNYF